MKAQFIRTIGKCSFNGYSFDVYENTNGSATIRPCRFSNTLPAPNFILFDSLNNLEKKLNDICGDLEGVDRVRKLIEVYL